MLGLFKWLRRPAGTQHHEDAEIWEQALAAVPILQGLRDEEQARLIRLGRQLLKRKTLTQLGVELTARQQAVLALQAVLPILHLGLDWYRGFHEIILIPEPVTRRQEVQDEFGLVSEVEEENPKGRWCSPGASCSRMGTGMASTSLFTSWPTKSTCWVERPTGRRHCRAR